MIIVDYATFIAMHRDYEKWHTFYTIEDEPENPMQRAINALVESLGTIINEAEVKFDLLEDDEYETH